MRHLFRKIMIAGLAATPLFGGYSYSSAVTFTGVSGSTQTNITLLFSFSDAKLKAAANGGQIQNLCSRNGSSVPCDFVFTDDATCATLSGGYTWGLDGDYSATAGTGHGWIGIPSYTTSGITPTLCIGNSAVSTYQGGAVGAEFDSTTVGRWHFANGTSLSVTDFSANNIGTTTINGASAVAGKIDGGMAVTGGARASASSNTGFNSTNFTVSCWFKTSTTGATQMLMLRDDGSSRSFHLRIETSNKVGAIAIFGSVPSVVSASTYTDGNWHLATLTVGLSAGTSTLTLYVDAVSQGTATTSGSNSAISIPLEMGYSSSFGAPFTGSLDEGAFASTARSANWIATEYANQSAPPAIGSFIALSSGAAAPVPAAVY